MLIASLVDLYSLIVLIAVFLSWAHLDPRSPFVALVRALTEPALAPIRRVLPPLAGIDLSPMLLLMALQLVKGML